jgi:hypothetical protein
VTTHLAVLILLLGYAGVRPFNTVTAETISVDIVSPDEVKEATKQVPPETPPLDIPDLSAKEQSALTPKPPSQSPHQVTPPAPQPNQKADARQAAAQPSTAAPSQPAPPPQPASPWLPNLAGAAQPDVSVKYQVNLGLPLPARPGDDFDAPASSTAKVSTDDIAKFRERLKTCSVLPGSITPNDKVTIRLRASFLPDGTLASPPLLIEASASAKGPLLMQAAIDALAACQPYALLPADKYNEWKVLDLSFTPRDFRGG